ncbi:hypothetical protein SC936_04885 [Aggregatibacter actinomycetemcomitans serotype e str. SC936]|nr:hypothetical protein SA3096_05255 [Aggregatibacter actinomycetemcomitans serotype e str. SA3096]KYK81200.1 hypothetical protein SC936_04885 [Aggregatibacter actinomycetemcomitans serotype e str. SC936]
MVNAFQQYLRNLERKGFAQIFLPYLYKIFCYNPAFFGTFSTIFLTLKCEHSLFNSAKRNSYVI